MIYVHVQYLPRT